MRFFILLLSGLFLTAANACAQSPEAADTVVTEETEDAESILEGDDIEVEEEVFLPEEDKSPATDSAGKV